MPVRNAAGAGSAVGGLRCVTTANAEIVAVRGHVPGADQRAPPRPGPADHRASTVQRASTAACAAPPAQTPLPGAYRALSRFDELTTAGAALVVLAPASFRRGPEGWRRRILIVWSIVGATRLEPATPCSQIKSGSLDRSGRYRPSILVGGLGGDCATAPGMGLGATLPHDPRWGSLLMPRGQGCQNGPWSGVWRPLQGVAYSVDLVDIVRR
jgi:hypothetical protein